jgi:ABC-type spermidine/putrescine transport system permease subunit I
MHDASISADGPQGIAAGEASVSDHQTLLDRHPRLRNWLLVLPGTIWMAVFVGIPVASIILFSFWKSGFAGLVPDYSVRNYVAILSSRSFWSITLWTYEVVLIALAGVILLSYPAAYGIWRIIRDERWKTAVLLVCIDRKSVV